MKLNPVPAACLVALLSCTAHAADLRLGLSVEGTGLLIADAGVAVVPGVEVSATFPVSRQVSARAKLGASYFVLPILRLEGTLLSRGETYFGAGLGTGFALGTGDPGITQASAVVLANVHALIGRNFGPAQVEVQARAGLIYSVGLNVNYLLPSR